MEVVASADEFFPGRVGWREVLDERAIEPVASTGVVLPGGSHFVFEF